MKKTDRYPVFTIDLLGGRGVPARNRPEVIAIASAGFVVPFIAAMVIFGAYLNNRVTVAVASREIEQCRGRIERMSEGLSEYNLLKGEMSHLSECLREIAEGIGRHTQWTGILKEISTAMPETMIVTEIQVRQKYERMKKVYVQDNVKKSRMVDVPVRTMKMVLAGKGRGAYGSTVKAFMEGLRGSRAFIDRGLQNIRVSQKSNTFGSEDVISYEIDCIFKKEGQF